MRWRTFQRYRLVILRLVVFALSHHVTINMLLYTSALGMDDGIQSPRNIHGLRQEYRTMIALNDRTIVATKRDYQKQVQEEKLQQWGVHLNTPQPSFPTTYGAVAEQAFQAISTTLQITQSPPPPTTTTATTSTTQEHLVGLDPNIASNAMCRSTILHYRPVKHPTRDIGRIGIEIDGARYLLRKHSIAATQQVHQDVGSDDNNNCSDPSKIRRCRISMLRRDEHDSEALALNRLVLILAARLSQQPWADKPSSTAGAEEGRGYSSTTTLRPVALFFNTIRLALLASQQLQILKREEKNCMKDTRAITLLSTRIRHGTSNSSCKTKHKHGTVGRNEQSSCSIYDNIQICCLGHDGIPLEMTQTTLHDHDKTPSKAKRKNLHKGIVDPTKGIIIIVQPTTLRSSSSSSSWNQSTLDDLQQLAITSSIYGLPFIVVSPRLGHDDGTSATSTSSNGGVGGGLDSSGYEHSSTYGGNEPPRSTPWLLRDFTPPAYVWINSMGNTNQQYNNAFDLSDTSKQRTTRTINQRQQQSRLNVPYIPRIGITRSVINIGHHSWHIFANIVYRQMSNINNESTTNENNNEKQNHQRRRNRYVQDEYARSTAADSFQYLTSTIPSSGRPSHDAIQTILKYWMMTKIYNEAKC